MSSSKLNRILNQAFGVFLGMAIAVWVLRGFGILVFLPGGVIWLLVFGAIAMAVLSHVQKTWWRY
ncbi:hypothetical protein [Brasilonema sp. UFV-L1]|uniref:hypothetical protein n=1 Tax=Brasilonema sp. UFV-L1 TaxID=2234130 RepID=UPI00145DFA01|nr:hypothetical protein [Brasilonema sp. UFV-L1]NMG06879.1 hypothetical protein [Brasilonema sp. UFV-L1]